MNNNWAERRFSEIEQKIAEQLKSFVPAKVFDSHAHIYRKKDEDFDYYIKSKSSWFKSGPDEVTINLWRKHLKRLLGRNPESGFFSVVPFMKDVFEKGNEFLIQQLEKNPGCYGLLFVTPDSPIRKIEAYLRNPQIVGLKVYHVFSKIKPTLNSPVFGFLPEKFWELAHHYKLVILLHPVRYYTIADPANYTFIRRMCKKYPKVRLILAHMGASFNTYNFEKGIEKMKDLENIFVDTSVICESSTILAAIQKLGTKRILWGTDYPLSQRIGRSFTIGDGFLWLDTENFDWHSFSSCRPICFGLESLRALKQSAEQLGLTRSEIQDIFYSSAMRLLKK
ncbi:MAG: amidohydrolase family protein [Candidatus Omnitrophica bacterium]|nr:amidohydrolase family protein [Candidatus Omnitrophota bacterium]